MQQRYISRPPSYASESSIGFITVHGYQTMDTRHYTKAVFWNTGMGVGWGLWLAFFAIMFFLILENKDVMYNINTEIT